MFSFSFFDFCGIMLAIKGGSGMEELSIDEVYDTQIKNSENDDVVDENYQEVKTESNDSNYEEEVTYELDTDTNEDYEDDGDGEEEYYEDEDSSNILSILSLISTWFIRFGLTSGVILLIYFLFSGQLKTAFLYVIGLVVAYFFGYFFMFCLDHFVGD